MVAGDQQQSGTATPISILRDQVKLILELCHFTQDLNPLWSADKSFEKLRILSEPIKSEIQDIDDELLVYEKVRSYFFEILGFENQEADDLDFKNCLLPEILETRKGPTPLLMLLFISLLEEANIKSKVASCRKRFLLKVQIRGRAHICDFHNQGDFLDHQEILNLVNGGFDFSEGSMQCEYLVIEYLYLLKKLSKDESRLHVLSLIHSYLMKYQPFNLKHLSERALVAYETGDYKTALEDIRSYFQYKQPEFTNQKLKKVYKLALRKIGQ